MILQFLLPPLNIRLPEFFLLFSGSPFFYCSFTFFVVQLCLMQYSIHIIKCIFGGYHVLQ